MSILQVPSANDNPTGKKAFFAMGDNSTDSLDGRAWGFVPENEIIGKAFLVYYPFTKRWVLLTNLETVIISHNMHYV